MLSEKTRNVVAKVPEITVYFWIVKVLTTAMGEATSDFMNARFGPAIAVPIMLIGLTIALRRSSASTRSSPSGLPTS